MGIGLGFRLLCLGIIGLALGFSLLRLGILRLAFGLRLLRLGIVRLSLRFRLLRLGILRLSFGFRLLCLGILRFAFGFRLLCLGIIGFAFGFRLLRLGIIGFAFGFRLLRLGILCLALGFRLLRLGILRLSFGLRLLRLGVIGFALGFRLTGRGACGLRGFAAAGGGLGMAAGAHAADFFLDFLDFGHVAYFVGLHRGALFFRAEDAVDELRFAAQAGQGGAGGGLLTLLLGVALSVADGDVFDEDYATEHGAVAVAVFQLFHAVVGLDAVFLRPFEELALEVDFLVGQSVDVDEAAEDALLDEPLAEGVAAVQVDGADEGLEGIAADVAVVRARAGAALYEAVEAQFLGQAVERGALYDLAARAG